MLWLYSSCTLAVPSAKKLRAGEFLQSVCGLLGGWTGDAAPDSQSLAGDTRRGAFGQRISVRVGLRSRGVGAAINDK
jgi:hypothetical protein